MRLAFGPGMSARGLSRLTAIVSSTAQLLLLLLQLSSGWWLLLSASSVAGVWRGWWRPMRGIWLQAHQPKGKRSRLPRLAAWGERRTWFLGDEKDCSIQESTFVIKFFVFSSVGDSEPDPDPQDPLVFGSPGSGSIFSQRYESGYGSGSGSSSGSLPFLIKVLSGLK